MMRKAGMSQKEAMDFCDIPPADQPRYAAMLG